MAHQERVLAYPYPCFPFPDKIDLYIHDTLVKHNKLEDAANYARNHNVDLTQKLEIDVPEGYFYLWSNCMKHNIAMRRSLARANIVEPESSCVDNGPVAKEIDDKAEIPENTLGKRKSKDESAECLLKSKDQTLQDVAAMERKTSEAKKTRINGVSTSSESIGSSSQPFAATKPAVATQPLAMSQPVTATQPLTITQPLAVTQPVVATQPLAVTQPLVAAQPLAVTQPVVATQPLAVTQPVGATQPLAATQPVAQLVDLYNPSAYPPLHLNAPLLAFPYPYSNRPYTVPLVYLYPCIPVPPTFSHP